MRASRAAVLATGCAAIVGAGLVAAPDSPARLDLAGPAEPEGSAAPVPSASGTVTVDGPVVTNARGDFQARITVDDGRVTDVQAVVAGTADGPSVAVNATAVPALRERVLEAQSWEVDAVSGASYTSPAFLESVRGAFEQAGL